jgi:hypothetical protein
MLLLLKRLFLFVGAQALIVTFASGASVTYMESITLGHQHYNSSGALSDSNYSYPDNFGFQDHSAWSFMRDDSSENGGTHMGNHNSFVSTDYVGLVDGGAAGFGGREHLYSFDLSQGGTLTVDSLSSAQFKFTAGNNQSDGTFEIYYHFSATAPYTNGTGGANVRLDDADAAVLHSSVSVASGSPWEEVALVKYDASEAPRLLRDVNNTYTFDSDELGNFESGDKYLTLSLRYTGGTGSVNIKRSNDAPTLTYQFTTIPELRATSLFVGTIVLGWIVCSRRRAVRTAC